MKQLSMLDQLDQMESNGKLLPFSAYYIIYPDGRVYSLRSNKFLKKVKNPGKTSDKYYYTYDLGTSGKHLVSRLIMFVFGKHNYNKITEMPKITLKNNNLEDLSINNLTFVTQSEINKKYNIKPTEKCYLNNNNQKIKEDQIEIIKNLRNQNFSLKKIGLKYNTSEMSVHRFIKKYKL
ncbi:hypothetical protein [Flavobacterium sp. I3-2]|uniref:hypothetical protein n=1 Tax=Flavobacterium sp. I3-2 TaxID=2748319 RepID=UPI0015B35D94|nr:hypothetical protein [Flavobacterium sp. I3-2]